MGKNSTTKKAEPVPVVSSAPAQEPDINEVDGKPIFHAPEEEGDGDE